MSEDLAEGEKLIAEFHVSLGLDGLPELAEAMQRCVGEVLYFRGPGLRVVSKGEPYPRPTQDGVRGYLVAGDG